MSPIDHQLQETLGELVLLKATQEKIAFFKGIGSGLDWVLNKGYRAVKPVALRSGRAAWRAPRAALNLAAEVGGIKGLDKERKLLQLIRARQGMGPAWDTVKAMAEARGMKSPVTAVRSFMSPMHTLSGRATEGGYARWLLSELKDPMKRRNFLRGATRKEIAAVKKLEPYFDQANRAGSTSVLSNVAPIGFIGGPLAYNLATGSDPSEYPVVTSPNRGLAPKPIEGPGMFSQFWGSKGDT